MFLIKYTGSVSALNSDRQALTLERRRAWLLVDFRHPSSQLLYQAHCLLTLYARRLDGGWDKVDASNDVRILGDLSQFCSSWA